MSNTKLIATPAAVINASTDTAYGTMTKSVISAVDYADKSENKWQNAGAAVRAYFPSRENLEAVKAQFIADAILPAIPKHAAALAVELPRKGSVQYKALSTANLTKWDAADKAKKAARATADTYFTRVLNYAFPKIHEEKSEEEKAAANSLETKFNKVLSDLIGKCEKAENATFDVVAVKAALVKAQKLVNKSAE